MSTRRRRDLATAILGLTLLDERPRKQKKKRKVWVKEWIKRRDELGAYKRLMVELRNEDQAFYKNFTRMASHDFDHLLELVAPRIKKQDTRLRKAISPGERLAITLRFLATGNTRTK